MTNDHPPLTIHRPRLVPHARYRWDKLRGEHQLVFPEGILVLNETGAAIVRLCDGRPFSELVAALGERFPEADLGEDVRAFLDRLLLKGLLLNSMSDTRSARPRYTAK